MKIEAIAPGQKVKFVAADIFNHERDALVLSVVFGEDREVVYHVAWFTMGTRHSAYVSPCEIEAAEDARRITIEAVGN